MSNVEGENVAGVTKVETSHGEVKIITYKSGELLIDIPDSGEGLKDVILSLSEEGEPGVFGPGVELNVGRIMDKERQRTIEAAKDGLD